MGLFGDPLENCEPGNQWHGCPNCARREAENAALREKLVQIHICAENAQYGQLDVWAAINSIVKSAANEYVEGK